MYFNVEESREESFAVRPDQEANSGNILKNLNVIDFNGKNFNGFLLAKDFTIEIVQLNFPIYRPPSPSSHRIRGD